MKRILIVLFVAIIGLAALPSQQAQASIYNACNNYDYCLNNFEACGRQCVQTFRYENPNTQRQQWAAAYRAAGNKPPQSGSNSQPGPESALRSNAALGLSVFMLVVGLLAALARLSWQGLAPWLERPVLGYASRLPNRSLSYAVALSMLIITLLLGAALMPIQQAHATIFPAPICPTSCVNGKCPDPACPGCGCALPSLNQGYQPAAANLDADKQPPQFGSKPQSSTETVLRRNLAIGLSLLILLVGLAALARLSWQGLALWLGRPFLGYASRLRKRSLSYAVALSMLIIVLLLGAALMPTPIQQQWRGGTSTAARVTATELRMERLPNSAGRVPSWKLFLADAKSGQALDSTDLGGANWKMSQADLDRTPNLAVRATPLAAASQTQPEKVRTALQLGGTGTTQIGGTTVDRFGNLYVTGGFSGTIVFNTSPQTTLVATADYDFFLAKFNSAGQCLWARTAQGATGLAAGLSVDGGLSLVVDNQGNCYVAGGFVKRLMFKDANNNTLATLTDAGPQLSYELFVSKYDNNGGLLWASGGQSGSPQHPSDLSVGVNGITDLALDGAGNPYVCGTFTGTNFLGTPVAVKGGADALVARLHPATGNPVWVSLIGSAGQDSALGLGVDNAFKVHVVGGIEGEATFPTEPPQTGGDPDSFFTDTFFAEYDQNGNCTWAGTIVAGDNSSVYATDIAVTGAGQEYIVGQRYDFFLDEEVGILTKFEPNAEVSSLDDYFPGGHADKVTLDGAGNPYVTGILFGEALFGFDDNLHVLTSLGDGDQFIVKYRKDPDEFGRGVVDWARTLPGSGVESKSLIPGVKVAATQLAFNNLTGAMHLSGDFSGTLSLDARTLFTTNENRHGFVAALCPAISLPETLPAALAGMPYNHSLAATPAGSYTYSLTQGSLPSGFSFNSSTGTLSGTATTIGTYNFTLCATNADGCKGTQAYTLDVTCPSITVNPASLVNGAVGAAYSQTLSATPAGGNYNFAVTAGALPPGLSLNGATGVISGTPTTTGAFGVTIRATGFGTCQASRAYTITIGNGGCPTITLPASLPQGRVGQLYNQSLAASPSGSYSYTLSGAVPPGVTFYNSAALLYGYPTTAGTFGFTITATTASGCTGSRAYTVTISTGAATVSRPITNPPLPRSTPPVASPIK